MLLVTKHWIGRVSEFCTTGRVVSQYKSMYHCYAAKFSLCDKDLIHPVHSGLRYRWRPPPHNSSNLQTNHNKLVQSRRAAG